MRQHGTGKGVHTMSKSKKMKGSSVSKYIRGEPGDLSLILVPIHVQNSHWILCVSNNIIIIIILIMY